MSRMAHIHSSPRPPYSRRHFPCGAYERRVGSGRMSQQTLKIRIIDRQAGGAGLDWEIAGPVEFGRQRQNEPDPPARLDASDAQRIIVAPLLDVSIPRIWFRVEPVVLGSC